jgi:hypothetical protein
MDRSNLWGNCPRVDDLPSRMVPLRLHLRLNHQQGSDVLRDARQGDTASVTTLPNIVWVALLDARYKVTIVRKEPYRGSLELRDGEDLILEQDVGLSYDAMFGPDAADVVEWREIATQFIDKRTAAAIPLVEGIKDGETVCRHGERPFECKKCRALIKPLHALEIEVDEGLLRYEDGWTGAFTRAQAETALYANGFRVRKSKQEPTDATPLGTCGTVLGSVCAPGRRPAYFIEWDNHKKVAAFILEWKIEAQ